MQLIDDCIFNVPAVCCSDLTNGNVHENYAKFVLNFILSWAVLKSRVAKNCKFPLKVLKRILFVS